jgi:hypothetical protein
MTIIRSIALATSAVLVGGILTVASFAAPVEVQQPASAAAVTDEFNPGMIISDAVMFDSGAMSVGAIQSFLNSKVSSCDPGASAPCLKDYRTDTHDIAAVENRCTGDIAGKTNQTAAEIIYAVSIACQVNPKAIIVTLQKEQGLVTSTSPTAGKYRIATGYGCPDTAPCNKEYYGFFNQVYQTAYAFNKYTKSPTQYSAYQPGTRKIKYHPNNSCGTKSVTIQNKATSALYFYTPYVPNGAALNAGFGIGDKCSSYGNRNFWLYFTAWFGSTKDTDPYFIKNASTKQIYLIVDGKRRPIESKREMRLIAKYTGIPYKLPSMSDTIVSQIGRGSTRVIVPGTVVKSKSSSKLWIIDGLNTKRPISKKQAIELTGSSSAKTVEAKAISGYTTGKGTAKLGLKVNGKYFIADKGIIRQIRASEVKHYKSRFGFGSYNGSTLAALDRGASIGRLIRYDDKYYLVRDGRKIVISTSKYKQLSKSMGKKAQPVDGYFAGLLPTKR